MLDRLPFTDFASEFHRFESQVGENGETIRLRLIDTDGIRRKGKTTGIEEELSAHPAGLPHSSRNRQSLYFS